MEEIYSTLIVSSMKPILLAAANPHAFTAFLYRFCRQAMADAGSAAFTVPQCDFLCGLASSAGYGGPLQSIVLFSASGAGQLYSFHSVS